MVCAPVRSIIPSPKLGDYLSVQAHKPCSISHLMPHLYNDLSTHVNFQCRCVLLIWIKVGQGSSVLAVGAGGRLDICSLVYHFPLRSPSLWETA